MHAFRMKERSPLAWRMVRNFHIHFPCKFPAEAYFTGVTQDDVSALSPKFWDIHVDPITCLDGAATTLLTIQYNLVAGTLTQFGSDRRDMDLLIDDILKFKKMCVHSTFDSIYLSYHLFRILTAAVSSA